ncbi:MAG: hypothetical protein ACTHZ1_06880 [Sphingobacterium sp.]
MKLNTVLVAALLASTSLSSCVFKTASERQLKYTHTSLADGDAYAFFRQVGTIAPYELSYAEHVTKVGNTQAKDAAEKITSFFNEILPQMDSLATKNQVVFPILGTQEYAAAETTAVVEEEMESTPVEDSLDTVALVEEPATRTAESYSDEVYLKHVQEQVAVVKEHFRRLSRNTNRELRDFAQSKTETVAELFTAVGGEEGAGAHH